METKALAYGIIGFLLGGLIVSTVAATQEPQCGDDSSASHRSVTQALLPVDGLWAVAVKL